jgi:hypothetical protein
MTAGTGPGGKVTILKTFSLKKIGDQTLQSMKNNFGLMRKYSFFRKLA